MNITPASPLSSPTDWFSNRELQRSQASGLDRIAEQAAESSSTATATQDGSSVPAVAVSVASVASALAPSPAVSALDSDQEQQDDDVVPSRSISQLTKPTDQSPVESPQRAIVDRSISQKESLVTPAQASAPEHRNLATDTLVPPKPITDHHDGPASDAESSDRSLQVPQARRRSVVSDVSSASPSPGPDDDQRRARRSVSLSPADDVPITSTSELRDEQQTLPDQPKSSAPSSREVGESVVSAVGRGAETTTVQPPTTESKPTQAAQSSRGGQAVVPRLVAEQSVPQPEQYGNGQHRPFSFAGIEGVGAIHQPRTMQEQDLSKMPSQPMSPISQSRSSAALSKEMSQVSVDEVTEQETPAGQRQSRSYSRPFGVDPNVKNHPALRSAEPQQQPIDRAQMYSTESPLPSANRPQEGFVSPQKQEQQPSPMHQKQPSDQGYRIPGPYVQQYRSPKQITSPKNGRSQAQVLASGNALPSAINTQQHFDRNSPQPRSGRASYIAPAQQNAPSYQDQPTDMGTPDAYAEFDMKPGEYQIYAQDEPVQQQNRPAGPPPVPIAQPPQQPVLAQPQNVQPRPEPQAERKKSAFGKLFGGSSSRGSTLQKQGRVGSPVEKPERPQKEKRGSFLRRNESVSSQQSSKHSGGDQLGQLPPPNLLSHSAKPQSRDALRSPTPENEKPLEGKKKRFSGLGGKLFKSSSNARAATAPTPPTHANGPEQQNSNQRMMSPGPYSAQSQRMMSPEQYSTGTPQGQYPAGPGSYFHQVQRQPQHPQSAYAQGQPHVQTPQYPAAASPYQHQPQSGVYNYSGQDSQYPPPHGQQQDVGPFPPGSSPYMNPNQNRPSDLRIDTSNQPRNQSSMPATAPARVHSPRTSSFGSAPYNPNPSPGVTTTTGAASPPPRSSKPPPQARHTPRAHVADLHKRSRSPRLGRPASDDLDVASRKQPRSVAGTTNNLGTFNSKKMSPVGGVPRAESDQERPFAITVPGLDDEEAERRKKLLRERIENGRVRSETPVSVESSSGRASHTYTKVSSISGLDRNVSVLEGYNNNPTSPRDARRSSARDRSTPGVIAELPGSKADGYESEEEIPMSATAYPGQEWMPVFVGDGRWDD